MGQKPTKPIDLRAPVEQRIMEQHHIESKNMREVLLLSGWRAPHRVDDMTFDDRRNTLRVELDHVCSDPYGDVCDLDVGSLTAKARINTVLRLADIRTSDSLHGMTFRNQRDTMITVLAQRQDRSPKHYQRMDDFKLAQVALEWFGDASTVNDILELKFDIGNAKVGTPKNMCFESRVRSNFGFDGEVGATLTVTDAVAIESRFHVDRTENFSCSSTVGVKFVIPGLTAEGGLCHQKSDAVTHGLSESKCTSQSVADSLYVQIKPRRHVKLQMVGIQASADVPYSARVKMKDGSERTISGVWKGTPVSVFRTEVVPTDMTDDEQPTM